MIEYGVACALVCALSAFDLRAMPYALLLSVWWVLGFLPPETAPVVTIIMSCLIVLYAEKREREWWDWVIIGCLPFMALADAIYQAKLAIGVYSPVEYAYALNILFSIQLACVAYPGGRRIVGVGVRLGRVFSRWCRGAGLGHREAGEAGGIKASLPLSGGCAYVGSDSGVYVSEEVRGIHRV